MTKFGIGQAVRRVEDQRFVTGHGRYVDDINLPRQAYGVSVLSPHAHARIKKVDVVSAAGAALCVDQLDMPLTSMRVWQAIRRADAAGGHA